VIALTKRRVWFVAAALAVACAAVLSAISGKAEAAFPGKNGTMAYTSTSDGVIHYSLLEPGGGAKTEVDGGHRPAFSPDGNGVARTVFGGASAREASSGTSPEASSPAVERDPPTEPARSSR